MGADVYSCKTCTGKLTGTLGLEWLLPKRSGGILLLRSVLLVCSILGRGLCIPLLLSSNRYVCDMCDDIKKPHINTYIALWWKSTAIQIIQWWTLETDYREFLCFFSSCFDAILYNFICCKILKIFLLFSFVDLGSGCLSPCVPLYSDTPVSVFEVSSPCFMPFPLWFLSCLTFSVISQVSSVVSAQISHVNCNCHSSTEKQKQWGWGHTF